MNIYIYIMRYPKISEFIKFLYGSVLCIFCKGIYYNIYKMEFVSNNLRENDSKKTDKKVEKISEQKIRDRVTMNTSTSTSDLNKTYVVIDKKKENDDDNKKTDDKPDSKISNDEINECSYYMLGDWLQKNQ